MLRETENVKPAPQGPDSFAGKRFHFIGIGGIGMSSLARLLIAWGAQVSGSDRSAGEMIDTLEREGARVRIGHSEENVDTAPPADVVVYTKAIPSTNPELAKARRLGIRTIHRAELLSEMMASRRSVCICGTHGKTTTTAMLAAILTESGKDPAVMLGGVYEPLGGNVRNGRGPFFVAEACEAYGSFLSLYPDIAVVTNIEPDHLDEGATFEDIRQSFREFLGRVPEGETIVACADSPEVMNLIPDLRARVETYGIRPVDPNGKCPNEYVPHWAAVPISESSYQILHLGNHAASFQLAVPGAHNALNALAAMAAANRLGVPPEQSAVSLAQFTGVDRRFSVRGLAGGVLVVDDYAHHPTEITATLAAARSVVLGARKDTAAHSDSTFHQANSNNDSLPPEAGERKDGLSIKGCEEWHPSGRIAAAFQPHLYSRTALFMDDFAASFEEADLVFLTDIYAAREEPIPGVSAKVLADRIKARFPQKQVEYVPELQALPGQMTRRLQQGDLALTLGAGDITTVGPLLLDCIRNQSGSNADGV